MAANEALSIEQVLAQEADAILGETSEKTSVPKELIGPKAQTDRVRINADERDGEERPKAEVADRQIFYRSLNKLNRAALCLSGGGIRSATFCLGVIQGLAAYDVTTPEPPERSPAEPRKKGALTEPKNSLLGRFHYLSTVSGGGYVGSWLSSWRKRDDFATIIGNLTGRPSGADVEPPEISWLRAYSNYLTPRIGIASADTWAAVAIVVRNLVLNWLVIVPVVCLALLILKFVVTISVWAAYTVDSWVMVLIALVGAIFLIIAQAFTTYHRPARLPSPPPPDPAKKTPAQAKDVKCPLCRRTVKLEKCFLCRRINANETCFLRGDLLWAVLSAIVVTIFFTSHYFSSLLALLSTYLAGDGTIPGIVKYLGVTPKVEIPALTAIAGFVIYLFGWLAGRPQVPSGPDCWLWAATGLVYGALVGVGAYLYSLLGPYSCDCTASGKLLALLLPVIFGVPWVLMAQLSADNIFGGLVSYEAKSDSDREWLGRAAGWLSAVAIAWAIVAFLVFAGGYFVESVKVWGKDFIVASGGIAGVISGIVTALLGSSAKTPAESSSDDRGGATAMAFNIGLAVAGPIFAAVLVIGLSVALDKMLLDDSLVDELQAIEYTASAWPILLPLLVASAITVAIGWLASWCVNINRFSLHALYRNRLVRAYLGASRQQRHPDLFTGFDAADNIRMHELWSKTPAENAHRLFHVINIALNVVSTKRLAWQERKAESFTVSPLHCGSAYLGFRPSNEYGDSIRTATGNFGIALGTAMAISGAAVSPNMGYNSSPSTALLLTLFNVRLGWWLGNPGPAGGKHEAYRREGPQWAAKPLFDEAFGQTTDTSPYVYLSDGGHFENLGLYEMVRRRCGFIVLVDAGRDPDFTFEDLGNAVRKIYIDLGMQITFEKQKLEDLKNRPPETSGAAQIPYYAIGTIHYHAADGGDSKDGDIVYIKPAYHGDESAGIMSYAMANKDFPHESTADQWFTESQFESYRSLGLEIADKILNRDPTRAVRQIIQRFLARPAPPS